MSCMLRVFGTSKFDPEGFLKRSKLEPYRVWHKGEPRFPRTKPKGEKLQFSGFSCEVSRKRFGSFSGQVKDAVRFLKRWKFELVRLSRQRHLDDVFLDFGIWKRDVVGQCDLFPVELVQVAGEARVGIMLSAYEPSPSCLKRQTRRQSSVRSKKSK